MFCRNCGADVQEGMKFCGACGTPVLSSGAHQNAEAKTPADTAKRKWMIPTVLAAVIVIGVLAFLLLQNGTIRSFTKLIEEQDYSEAAAAYGELSPEGRSDANTWLVEYVNEVGAQYFDGKLDYTTTSGILAEVSQYAAAYDTALETADTIYIDNQSSLAREAAKDDAARKMWADALSMLQTIHVQYRLYDEVAALQETCAASYRDEVLASFETYAAANAIDEMLTLYSGSQVLLPDDSEIAAALSRHLEAFVQKNLEDAVSFAEDGNYADAAELLSYANGIYPCSQFSDALISYEADGAAAHCASLASQGDLRGAVEYAAALAAEDSRYSSLLATYADQFVSAVLAEAQAYFDAREFQKAISVLTAAQDAYDCAEFSDTIAEYQTYLPADLADCFVLDKAYATIGDTCEDAYGNTYDNVVTNYARESHALFHLDGRFVSLTGFYIPGEDFWDDKSFVYRKIYSDGTLLYESPKLQRLSSPVNIDLNISGVDQLLVELYSQNYGDSGILDAVVS